MNQFAIALYFVYSYFGPSCGEVFMSLCNTNADTSGMLPVPWEKPYSIF